MATHLKILNFNLCQKLEVHLFADGEVQLDSNGSTTSPGKTSRQTGGCFRKNSNSYLSNPIKNKLTDDFLKTRNKPRKAGERSTNQLSPAAAPSAAVIPVSGHVTAAHPLPTPAQY
jgi:hypothetical protein